MTRSSISLALLCAGLAAQTPSDSLRFEVAALKPSLPDQRGGIIRPTPGNAGYTATNMPLLTYLTIAYTVRDSQISGAPSWLADDRYDLYAKAEKQSTVDELHAMLAHLLEDRCKLKFHMEKKEQSGFTLMLDKGTPKMTLHDPDDKNYPPMGAAGAGKLQATNASMSYFAFVLSRIVDRPVIDKTGMTGRYDFTVEFEFRPEATESERPSVFEALKSQLGLRLEAGKVMGEHLVIDHIEKPTEN